MGYSWCLCKRNSMRHPCRSIRTHLTIVDSHDPVASAQGDMSLALYGSFLPHPDPSVFPEDSQPLAPLDLPGAVEFASSQIALNVGRERVRVQVTNTGDRPIQVGSHFHFTEANRALVFDRELGFFRRLDIAAGTAVRFEPGDTKTVTLVDIAGRRRVTGGNLLLNCEAGRLIEQAARDQVIQEIVKQGFGHQKQQQVQIGTDVPGETLSRETYASMFGPTTGDKIRLADTELWIEIEDDKTIYGDELKFGGGEQAHSGHAVIPPLTRSPDFAGKVVREGMGQATGMQDTETLDLIITNALIIDWSGIYKVCAADPLRLLLADLGFCRLISVSTKGTSLGSARVATPMSWKGSLLV